MENKNLTIKRQQFDENLIPHDNPKTSECCQIWKNRYEEKLYQLTESVKLLKSSIEELTATTVQQNTVIMEALATQKVLTEKLLGKEKIETNLRKIQTADDLTNINNNINEINRAAYVHCMSSLLKGKLHKSLTEILCVNLIIASNIDGVHGKVSLKNFKKFYDALMDSIRANGEENAEKGMRYALKLVKKRHFQAICVCKKKEALADNNN